jgi:hypothetical protein
MRYKSYTSRVDLDVSPSERFVRVSTEDPGADYFAGPTHEIPEDEVLPGLYACIHSRPDGRYGDRLLHIIIKEDSPYFNVFLLTAYSRVILNQYIYNLMIYIERKAQQYEV